MADGAFLFVVLAANQRMFLFLLACCELIVTVRHPIIPSFGIKLDPRDSPVNFVMYFQQKYNGVGIFENY